MSLLMTAVYRDGIQMIADTRVTVMSGGFQTLGEGKITKSATPNNSKEFIVGTVGIGDHHHLLRWALSERPLQGDKWRDIFDFFAAFYEQAEQRGVSVYNDDGDFSSSFHIAFPTKAWVINGLSIEPVSSFSAIGSGGDFAIGALAAGASPFEAAKIACKHNVFCAFPIDVWKTDTNETFSHVRVNERGEVVTEEGPLTNSITELGPHSI